MSKARISRLAKRADSIAASDRLERAKRLGLSEEDFARVTALQARIEGELRSELGRDPEPTEVTDVMADELAAEAGVTPAELLMVAAKFAAAEQTSGTVVRVRVGPDKWEYCDVLEARTYVATFDKLG